MYIIHCIYYVFNCTHIQSPEFVIIIAMIPSAMLLSNRPENNIAFKSFCCSFLLNCVHTEPSFDESSIHLTFFCSKKKTFSDEKDVSNFRLLCANIKKKQIQ